jgi:hypothetical protein
MGQKVGGYRRNVPYGHETSLLSGEDQGKKERGWMFDVNPNGRVGWNMGTSGRKEKEYGKSLSDGRRLRKELEEVRRASGCESNGLGRKGTKETGYVVYGEYTSGSLGKGKPGSTQVNGQDARAKKRSRLSSKLRETSELLVARERVTMNYEKKRQVKVERKRTNLKDRRKEKGLEGDKEERRSVLGYSSKRMKAEERAEAIALSGRIPTAKRRTNLIVRELESGLNHMEVLRNRESLRTHHAKSSRRGRKRLGEVDNRGSRKEAGVKKGGYYGFNVTVKGPLEGARRTMAYVIQLGTVPRGTKRARMMMTHEHAKTKVGTVGVRITYCYGRG